MIDMRCFDMGASVIQKLDDFVTERSRRHAHCARLRPLTMSQPVSRCTATAERNVPASPSHGGTICVAGGI
ncbi:MAG: hypothetical protein EPN36_13195 [Rhodanobacteraceae bacterium]|nr:MAG: hypothetical protein EPN36_13195 [Rhodanobacteraceae bacterium]